MRSKIFLIRERERERKRRKLNMYESEWGIYTSIEYQLKFNYASNFAFPLLPSPRGSRYSIHYPRLTRVLSRNSQVQFIYDLTLVLTSSHICITLNRKI